MKDMMIVETRDPIQARDVEWGIGLLAALQRSGSRCTLLLAENGVLGARAAVDAPGLASLATEGVELLADRFALAERGIVESDLHDGIHAAHLEVVIDHLIAGGSVIWR